jgi:3-oxoacyl-[acyl-carrier-protein] synthase-3
MRATITSIAHYVPPLVYDNSYFESYLDTSDEWIRTRTGITKRHILSEGGTSDLIVPAAEKCLAARGITAEEIDCIIVATITPDHFFPSTAAVVQRKLGAKNAWGFDLSAACSGFIYALVTASKLVESGACRRVLLCGADKMSTITNYEDRTSAVLFGDAAAVTLIEQSDAAELGVVDHLCRIDGEDQAHLCMPAGGSVRPATAETVAKKEHSLYQDGQVVFKAAVSGMAAISMEIMRRNNLTTDSVSWLVPHQANLRILQAVARRMGIGLEKVMINVDRYGNTTAATIPLCLSEWQEQGLLRQGDDVVLTSFGAGFTLGSVYLRWSMRQSVNGVESGAPHSGAQVSRARAIAEKIYAPALSSV